MASVQTPHSLPLAGSKPTLINTDVDFERDGTQVGTLAVPSSRDHSGYGHIPTSIALLKNGQGPSLLLTADNHQYEDPVAPAKLIQRLSRQRSLVFQRGKHSEQPYRAANQSLESDWTGIGQ